MAYDTLIAADELQPSFAVFDCSFDLADTGAGERQFEAGHLPNAAYLHLDRDLSGAKTGRNGRHPLPTREAFAQRMRHCGIDDDTQVVAYDRSGGIFAARLWWMLRWCGHRAVAVLDGGFAAWTGTPETGPASARAEGRFTLRPPLVALMRYDELLAALPTHQVVDARAPDRFRGENETLDPVAGHIPGARNRFFKQNLRADGRFKPAAELRAEWDALRGAREPSALVQQCGSGVTACHNLLALERAGLPGSPLYAGSWSEWSAQPGAPVTTGDS